MPDYDGPDYKPYAPTGTCVDLGNGSFRVKGAKRWWVVYPQTRKCTCHQYLDVHSRMETDCSHLRSMAKHLASLAEPAEMGRRDTSACRRCGMVMDVSHLLPDSPHRTRCKRCRWLKAAHDKRVKAAGKITNRGEWDTTLRALETPTTADLYWIAGFLEGEGCFSCAGGRVRPTAKIAAAQVCTEPLYRLRRFLGGSVAPIKIRKDAHPNWKEQWAWKVSGPRARGIQLTLFSLLSSRRQDQILASWRRTQGLDTEGSRQ